MLNPQIATLVTDRLQDIAEYQAGSKAFRIARRSTASFLRVSPQIPSARV